MEVVLPETGCNIKTDTGFYNISTDGSVKENYQIYYGRSYLESVENGTFTYTGTCLETGDLVYKPELEVYFELVAIFCVSFILYFLYKITIGRFIK